MNEEAYLDQYWEDQYEIMAEDRYYDDLIAELQSDEMEPVEYREVFPEWPDFD